MNKYDLVIFDVDGTLLDTSPGILEAVKYTIGKMNLPLYNDEILSGFIGPPLKNTFRELYSMDDSAIEEAVTIFRDYYKANTILKASVYDGMIQVLENLYDAGIQIAVATYKRDDLAKLLMSHFHIDSFTSNIYGADSAGMLSKSDIIEKCIADSGVPDRRRVVMIGDSKNDAVGTQKAGICFIGVTYGFGFGKVDDIDAVKREGCANTPLELSELFISEMN